MTRVIAAPLAIWAGSVSAAELTEVTAFAVMQVGSAYNEIYDNLPTVGEPTVPSIHTEQLLACEDELEGFPEFIQPLIDFSTCVAAASTSLITLDDLLQIAPIEGLDGFSSAVLKSSGVLAACRMTVSATSPPGAATFVGKSDCKSLPNAVPVFQGNTVVSGTTTLLDLVNGAALANGSSFWNVAGIGSSSGSYVGSPTFPVKVKFTTSATASGTLYCPENTIVAGRSVPTCQVRWIVVPNKSPSTAARLSCDEGNTTTGETPRSTLSCEIDSPPFVVGRLP